MFSTAQAEMCLESDQDAGVQLPALLVALGPSFDKFQAHREALAFRDFALDSGAFAAMVDGRVVRVEDWIPRVREIAADPACAEVFALDMGSATLADSLFNGKVRGRVKVAQGASEDTVVALAMADENVDNFYVEDEALAHYVDSYASRVKAGAS